MEYNEIIKNVNIYGMDESIRGAKFPMATDVEKLNTDLTSGIISLASSERGAGHDNWLNGVVVQFDLTFTVKAWTEMERYHFMDFVSSQSTMHRIVKFNLDNAYIDYVDDQIIEVMKQKVAEYNQEEEFIKKIPDELKGTQALKELIEGQRLRYLRILYSNPCGMKLTARMTTNYRQLKTIYVQRRNHRLPEWQAFCDWIETLPHSELIIPKEASNGSRDN